MIDDRCSVCGAMGGYGLGSIGAMVWYCRAHRPGEWPGSKKEAPETRASIALWEETRPTAEPQTTEPSLADWW